jgi:hypothetical protein
MNITSPTYLRLLNLIGSLSADVHDTYTVNEHIQRVEPHGPTQHILRRVACFALGEQDSGYDDDVTWLSHLHYVMGIPHSQIIEALREWAHNNDPGAEQGLVGQVGWAYARKKDRYAVTGDHRPVLPVFRLVETADPKDSKDNPKPTKPLKEQH